MRTHKLPCGCVESCEREQLVAMCDEHRREEDQIHARWAEERRIRAMCEAAEARHPLREGKL